MVGSAILLAAGQSTRMGGLKGLLPWGEKTLFEHQLLTLLHSPIDDIVVVVGYQAEQFIQIAKHYPVRIIQNKNCHLGKCSSIITGLHSIQKRSEMILISAIDQPTETEVIQQLILSLLDYPIAIPILQGKRGHPILFSTKVMNDLLTITEETKGLRNVIQKYQNQLVEVSVNTPHIHLNLNTPKDYLEAKARFQPFSDLRRSKNNASI